LIKIVTDSTCNLRPDIVEQLDLHVAPISIQFGDETYEEGIDIDRATFYQKIDEMGIIPTTAQPTPAWFARYYEALAADGHQILTITITGVHSGTYDSAVLGKDMVPDADVEVFDSRSISLGTGWMILEAARMIDEGAERTQILDRLAHIRARMSLILTPSTLKYLQMSGRVGRLQGVLASMLKVLPIIRLEEGELEAVERIRTRRTALERVIEMTEEAVGTEAPVNLAVVHANIPNEAQEFRSEAEARFNVNELLFDDLVPSLAVHGGPGIMCLIAYPV
jgi:DegV family protein with EDD domain